MLYPIVICADSLLIKCGISLNSIPYTLDTKNYILSIFSLVIAPAICEELLFRGLIFKGLKRHGKAFSIIITAVMFTIFHLSISQTVYPLLMGLLLSFVMYRENNIIYCILIHMINNFISLTLSYAGVSLIFNHWTYIMLAIVLAVIFISILLICILKDNKKEDPIDRSGKIFLVCSLIIMSIIWLLNNIL